MGFLINPGMLNVAQISALGKIIFYSMHDLKAENLTFTRNIQNLVDAVLVPQVKQVTNWETIKAIEPIKAMFSNT